LVLYVTFYIFIKKNPIDAYRLFYARLFLFLRNRLKKHKIKTVNIILYGKLHFKYNKLFKFAEFTRNIMRVIHYTTIPHNGCRLKKKKRK
jgi:hypothetical protein